MFSEVGLFVCMLRTHPSQTVTHAIGVQCERDRRMIWDSSEKQAIEYNNDNIERCCPQGKIGAKETFYQIKYMGK